jgi:two-component system NtrC family sensor kinase
MPVMNKLNIQGSVITSTNRKRILLIDDDHTLLITLSSFLKKRYELVAIDKNAFDAVITDLNMPNINGEDIYNYIAEKYPSKKQYIIFMTGGDFTPEMNKFLANIQNPVLEKPFSTTKLTEVINQLLC